MVFLYHFFEKITKFLWGWDAFFRENLSEHLSRGEIALKFAIFCQFCEKFKLLITLDKKLLEAFWDNFWALHIFWVFATKIIVSWLHFFGKGAKFLRGWEAFSGKKIFKPFLAANTALKFPYEEKLNCS